MKASQPGKTAPLFLHDLLQFDPQASIVSHHVLLDHAPQFDGVSRGPTLSLGGGGCKHEYITHTERSNLPQLDERPEQHTQWKVAATCKRCRVYLTLFVHFPPNGCTQPCPNREMPLHHLRYVSSSLSGIEYLFACSSMTCQATVTINYVAPVLSPQDLELLTDTKSLERRYQDILTENPNREGVRLASPSDVLFRLRRYVVDSLNPENARRTFPAHNKRFSEAFATDCDEFLQRIGFSTEGGDDEKTWTLPSPQPVAQDIPVIDTLRAMLERLVIELQLLIDDYCASHATLNPSPRGAWRNAKEDLERVLSAQSYDRVPGRKVDSREDHPYYASLGALGDFSDQLVGFSYDRQADCDPENGPYYFDCLQDLATGRQSEHLLIKASTLASQDVLSQKDITQAYVTLGIDPNHAQITTDKHIIGLYRSRWSDSSPVVQAELKLALKKLAQARGSREMQDEASDTITTYEQALAWLNAEDSYPDDTIIAMYVIKVGDQPSTTETSKHAVMMIANKRNSESLRKWVATGQMTVYSMSTDEACRHLNIDLNQVDTEMLEYVFESARMDRPGTTTEEAIEAVRKAVERQETTAAHSTETWPVGLISHGNTCYLNSLLQYYFTIKPLRELVLQFDQFKYDLNTQGSKAERVGNLHRPAYEIESFQKLTDDLRHLFDRMIKDRGPAVRPETDLVCRAFLKPSSPEANTTTTQEADSVDVNMTSNETDNNGTDSAKTEVASDPLSEATSVTLPGSGFTPPATPKEEVEDDQVAPPLPPRKPAVSESRPRTNLEKAEEAARQQQDVAEVMEELLTRLRASIKALGQDSQGEQLDQLRDIFNMKIKDTYVPTDEAPVEKENEFTNIMLLPPYEPTDIYSALDRVLELHPEPDANKPMEMYKTMQSFPPILQISINRILMGRDGKPAKSEHRIKLEEMLYMDRYSENDGIAERRQQCWGWRRKLRNLQVERDFLTKTEIGMDGPTAIEKTGEYLAGIAADANADLEALGMSPINIPDDLPVELLQEAGLHRARLSVIEKEEKELQEKISVQFAGLEKIKYRLHAVFFHRGSTGHGHYWTYIYDFRNNMWRVYNDEKVEEFNKLDDILNAETWQQGTPTYAVYVRDDVKEQYVEPLCRDVEETVDQPMPDASWPDHPDQAFDNASTDAFDNASTIPFDDRSESTNYGSTLSGNAGSGESGSGSSDGGLQMKSTWDNGLGTPAENNGVRW